MKECLRVNKKQDRHGLGRNVSEESAAALRHCHDSFSDVLAKLNAVHANEQSEELERPASANEVTNVVEGGDNDEEELRKKRKKEKKERKLKRKFLLGDDGVDCVSESEARPESKADVDSNTSVQNDTILRSASTMSLFEVASRRRRIHYARYTRSKDVARLTSEDFRGVFGKPDEANEPIQLEPIQMATSPAEETVSQSSDPEPPSANESKVPLYNSQKTIAEYFAEKKRLKSTQSGDTR